MVSTYLERVGSTTNTIPCRKNHSQLVDTVFAPHQGLPSGSSIPRSKSPMYMYDLD